MIAYLKTVISGDDTGATYHRFLGVIAGITLCVSVLVLTLAVAWGREATAALLSVAGPLATMSTFVYRAAKSAESASAGAPEPAKDGEP